MRYIVAALITIGLLATVVVLIIKGISSPSVKAPTTSLNSQSNTPIQLSYVQDGIINNNILHRSIMISVNRSNINMTVYKGYQGEVLTSYNFPNNEKSFKSFLGSMGSLGFTSKRVSAYKTSTGLCPLGYRYSFSIVNSLVPTFNQNLWSTNCGQGTMAGNTSQIESVMQNQVPDYWTLINNVNLQQTTTQS